MLLTAVVAAVVCAGQGAAGDHGIAVRYRLRKPGRVSVNIHDTRGAVVRELLHAAPREAGTRLEEWDGLDERGEKVPPGTYSWKLLRTPGLKAEYVMTIGSNYPPGDGERDNQGAPGCHGGVMTAAADETGVYLGAFITENIEAYLVKLSHDGKTRLWSDGNPVPWKGAASMAAAGGRLFVLATNGEIWVYDSRSGRRAGQWKAAWGGEEKMPDLNWGTLFPYDLDAQGGQLVMSSMNAGSVRWLDPSNGTVRDEKKGFDKPRSVAISPDGTVRVLLSDSVVVLDRASKRPVTLIRGLDDPSRIDVDPSSGDVLVAERGKTQQVKRFSKSGRLIRSYGLKGGRSENGLYTPRMQRSFRDAADVACDPSGGFIICEPFLAPRRVARFAKSGRLDREWYGGQTWAPWILPEPGNPSAVWVNSQWGHMFRAVVDYRRRTWKVHSTYKFADLGGLILGHTNAMIWDFAERDGELYLCQVGHGGYSGPQALRVDRRNWRLLPATVMRKHVDHYKWFQNKYVKENLGSSKSFAFVDEDGDGTPGGDEIRWLAQDGRWGGAGAVDHELNWYFVDRNDRGGWSVYKNAVTGWTAAKAPRYADFPGAEEFVQCPPRVTKIEGRWGSYFYRDPETDDFYGAFNDRMTDWGRSTDSFLVKWDREGRHVWTVGRKAENAVTAPFSIRWTGQVEPEYSEEYTFHALTDDGVRLWVDGRLLIDNWKDQPPTETSGTIRLRAGTRHDIRMEYNQGGGGSCARLSWSSPSQRKAIVPQSRLRPAGGEQGAGLTGEYFDEKNLTVPRFTRTDPVVDFEWGTGAPGVHAGRIDAFRRIAGMTRGCIVLTNFYYGERTPILTYVWDRDGLYVGDPLKNPDLGAVHTKWMYLLGGEALHASLAEEPGTGNVLFYCHTENECRVYRIHGWDGWERHRGTVRVSGGG